MIHDAAEVSKAYDEMVQSIVAYRVASMSYKFNTTNEYTAEKESQFIYWNAKSFAEVFSEYQDVTYSRGQESAQMY